MLRYRINFVWPWHQNMNIKSIFFHLCSLHTFPSCPAQNSGLAPCSCNRARTQSRAPGSTCWFLAWSLLLAPPELLLRTRLSARSSSFSRPSVEAVTLCLLLSERHTLQREDPIGGDTSWGAAAGESRRNPVKYKIKVQIIRMYLLLPAPLACGSTDVGIYCSSFTLFLSPAVKWERCDVLLVLVHSWKQISSSAVMWEQVDVWRVWTISQTFMEMEERHRRDIPVCDPVNITLFRSIFSFWLLLETS